MEVLVKNTKEDSGKCKTIIEIDGAIVAISEAYTWDPCDFWKNSSQAEQRSGFEIGTADWNLRIAGSARNSIRNISIKVYE